MKKLILSLMISLLAIGALQMQSEMKTFKNYTIEAVENTTDPIPNSTIDLPNLH